MFVLGMMFAAVALAAGDVLQEPAQGDVHLDGFVGRKIGRFLDRRVRGDFAKPALRLEPIAAKGTWGAWNLMIGDRTVPVCDFGSAGDEYRVGGCQFSVWF